VAKWVVRLTRDRWIKGPRCIIEPSEAISYDWTNVFRCA